MCDQQIHNATIVFTKKGLYIFMAISLCIYYGFKITHTVPVKNNIHVYMRYIGLYQDKGL